MKKTSLVTAPSRSTWAWSLAPFLLIAACNDRLPVGPREPVTTEPVTSVVVTPASDTIGRNDTLRVSVTLLGASAQVLRDRRIAWSSSNPLVLTVDSAGLVRGVSLGQAVVVATSQGLAGTATIDVVVSVVTRVRVTPDSVPLITYGQAPLRAELFDRRSRAIAGQALVWSSSRDDVVSVDAKGLLTAHQGAGSAYVVAAEVGGLRDSAAVVVALPAVTLPLIRPVDRELVVGDTMRLFAQAVDVAERNLSGVTITWASDNPLIARVDSASGLVTGVGPGTAQITAKTGSGSNVVQLTVIDILAGVTETDLGTLGGAWAAASGISDAGVVVGNSGTAYITTRAFRWTAGGGMEDLGALGGANSAAAAISASGVIVGWAQNTYSTSRAFRWTRAGGMRDLGTLVGGESSGAMAVNSAGEVVGWSDNGRGQTVAVRWDTSGAILSLLPLSTDDGRATGINDRGEIVGYSDICVYYDCSSTAFRWSQPAGATNPLAGKSYAYAIDSAGNVVGQVDGHAFRLLAGGGLSTLASYRVIGWAWAYALNDQGQVVGSASQMSPSVAYPSVWSASDGIGRLSIKSGLASGINNAGQVVGIVNDAQGQRAKLWTLPPAAVMSALRIAKPAAKPTAGPVATPRAKP